MSDDVKALEINRLCEGLIAYRDTLLERPVRDFLADVCNALDGYVKLTREHDRLATALSTAESAGYARGVEEAARVADADADCWAVALKRHTHSTPLTGRRIASSIRALSQEKKI